MSKFATMEEVRALLMSWLPGRAKRNIEEGHVHRIIDGQGFLAYDSFNRADSSTMGSSDSGHAWTETEGDWQIATNAAQVLTVGTDTVATMDVGSQDVGQVVVSISTAASAANIDAGIVFRVLDGDNLLLVRIRGSGTDRIQLFAKTAGTYGAELKGMAFVPSAATTYQLHVYWDGAIVRGYVTDEDGTEQAGFIYRTLADTFTPFIGATKVGLRHDTSSGSGDSFTSFAARLGNAVASSQVTATTHTALTGVTADQHHAEAHVVTSHSDEANYLLAAGSRAGSSSQAQDFGATGLKADVIAESTAAAGVKVDGLYILDNKLHFGGDASYAMMKVLGGSVSMRNAADTGYTTFTADQVNMVSAATATSYAARAKEVQNGSHVYVADSGAADAYVITLAPAVTAYVAGQKFHFNAANANTGASTLNVNALGVKDIKKLHDQALAAGDIEAGQIVTVAYDGTNFQMQSQVASAAAGGGDVATDVIWDAKGDLAVGTGADTAQKLTVGANGSVPEAASGETTGIKWTLATRTIILSAGGGKPTTTAGCAEAKVVEAGTNDIDYWVLDFDATAKEYAFWVIPAMPDNYDGGTVTARFIWSTTQADAAKDVRWGIQGLALGDAETIDAAYGTTQEVTDTATATANQRLKSAATSAITIAGTPAGGESVIFRAYRDPTHADDDSTVDARLWGIQIEYQTASYSD